ncbi:MAG: LCP family protein [Anaerolineales bacterium]|jgi:LCP family protein required for cell wall assembly
MSEPKRSNRKRVSIPPALIKVLAGAFIIAGLLSIYLVYSAVRDLASSWSGSGLPSFSISRDSGTQPSGEALPTSTVAPLEQLPDPWKGNERVTVLLMGLDYRDWESGEGPPRTDSMMLGTVDPVSETAGMLSIPRDLWVEIPGYSHGRINTAYFLGERDRLPGGGPELAVKTVENFLGVPINYYVQIDFTAFERMVDELGGVEINVPAEITVDPIGPHNTVTLEPGVQTLSGPVALAYARNRHTDGGDFDRAQRQQQVALAIRSQILRLNMLPTLIAKAPALYNDLAEGIRTNLSLNQMIALGLLALQIPPENVTQGVIAPPDMVTLESVTYGGEDAQVLKPVPDQIRMLRDQVFAATSAIGPSISVEDPAVAAKSENAKVAVLNGAGEEGLASRFAEALEALGFTVTEIGNADRMDYPTTRIVDYTGNPYTAQYLVDLMDLTQSQVLSQTVPDNEIDLALVVGYDWQQLYGMLKAAAPN